MLLRIKTNLAVILLSFISACSSGALGDFGDKSGGGRGNGQNDNCETLGTVPLIELGRIDNDGQSGTVTIEH